jgi:hypothetical protein
MDEIRHFFFGMSDLNQCLIRLRKEFEDIKKRLIPLKKSNFKKKTNRNEAEQVLKLRSPLFKRTRLDRSSFLEKFWTFVPSTGRKFWPSNECLSDPALLSKKLPGSVELPGVDGKRIFRWRGQETVVSPSGKTLSFTYLPPGFSHKFYLDNPVVSSRNRCYGLENGARVMFKKYGSFSFPGPTFKQDVSGSACKITSINSELFLLTCGVGLRYCISASVLCLQHQCDHLGFEPNLWPETPKFPGKVAFIECMLGLEDIVREELVQVLSGKHEREFLVYLFSRKVVDVYSSTELHSYILQYCPVQFRNWIIGTEAAFFSEKVAKGLCRREGIPITGLQLDTADLEIIPPLPKK